MSDLENRRCKPCEGDAAPLSESEARDLLARVDSSWKLVSGGKAIRRTFEFDDFYRTMALVNAIAWIAHREDHHPDLEVGYSTCRVTWSTHAIDGLSENDFICAAKVDALG